MNILITGISGFIGYHLVDHLLSRDEGHDICGFGFWRGQHERYRDGFCCPDAPIHYEEVDILDALAVRQFVGSRNWDAVFHLAGQAVIPTANKNVASAYQLNVMGTVNLLEALREQHKQDSATLKLVQLSSSSDVYGDVPEKSQPIAEERIPRPDNAYGGSKAAMELVGMHYRREHGMPVISTRLFTCAGPKQWDDLLVGFLTKRFAQFKLGLAEPRLGMGRLDNKRSFIDVRDVVRAYWRLQNLRFNEYVPIAFNVAGTEVWTIGHIVDTLKDISGVDAEVYHEPKFVRPKDKLCQIGDGKQLKLATGFEPTIPFQQTLEDSYQWWLGELG